MSSELESAVSSIVENNYATIVILTAMVYDYILTFSDEIEHIWRKPLTRMTILFFLVRYFALLGGFLYVLMGSSFLPGPAELIIQGEILVILGEWALSVFVLSADLSMILRVWAIYMQSNLILGILLTVYSLEIVAVVIACVLVSMKARAGTAQVLTLSVCVVDYNPTVVAEVIDSLQFALSAAMFLLVAAEFIRQSYEMYYATRQWRVNRFMNLFVKEGMLYFIAIFLFAFMNILIYRVKIPVTGWNILPLTILQYVPVLTLCPRFILSVRVLHARGLVDQTSSERRVSKIGISLGNVEQSTEDGMKRGEDIRMKVRRMRNARSRW